MLRDQVSKESNALTVSKEFLRKQRQSLKRRQAALQAAKQELTRDVLRQKQGVRKVLVLTALPHTDQTSWSGLLIINDVIGQRDNIFSNVKYEKHCSFLGGKSMKGTFPKKLVLFICKKYQHTKFYVY